ncbi:uncharacterized protein LOC131433920 [Malaya genurostris]|uniref:uncharacterized protein LOC131433920 n=1 Tax=Malaya genurostris TaxID=325434 RepID=UPI0026F3AA84|nr:uncharacterized protein LOC131433920 [Malaya genurostris]
MVWTRPEKPAIPNVWYTFQAKDADSDHLVTYRVEDLTEDRHEDMIQHYLDNFLDDEPFCQNKQISKDELALKEMRSFYQWCFNERMTIVCYKNGSDEIIGGNLLHVKGYEKLADFDLKSESIRDIILANDYMTDQFKIHEHYGVDQYLTAYGLAINRCYRGRGIATEMLKARVPMCRTFGIKLTATNFTALGSQLAAAKAGFETNFEMSFEDFAKLGPRYSFPGIQSKSLKLMSLRIE